MKAKILFVEDDVTIGSIVSESLTKQGYEVDWLKSAQHALIQFHKTQHHICILDIMIPGKTGIELAQDIRSQHAQVPILFLSAKSQTADIVEGFKAGANDYLKKPFSLEELLVRIETLLKFNAGVSLHTNQLTEQHIGQIQFNYTKQILVTNKQVYSLSFKENEIVHLLVQNMHYITPRNEILNIVWGSNTFFNSRILDVYITKIRNYFKDDEAIQLLTIRGVGYKLTTI